MLLRRAVLDRVVTGEVDLAFRRWTRPTVKTGGSLRTAAGLLQIVKVEPVPIESITEDDALRAGLGLEELLRFLRQKPEGDVYRVELGSIGPDPRMVLGEDDDLSDEDLAGLRARLDRLDAVSKRGPWTRQFLRLLASHPHVRAQELADGLGLERDVFKNDVRKLKALGLTISHSPGYELSPRGREFLNRDRGRSGSSAG
ncbi:MAG TPA: HTH domain-containing protein [Acidimicrobiia bacterium]|nr:HTH domain-containing protein [Acidimicrobiia bacterium]